MRVGTEDGILTQGTAKHNHCEGLVKLGRKRQPLGL